MGIANTKVASIVLEQLVFGYSPNPVKILAGYYDASTDTFELLIKGDDIPCDAGEVKAELTQHTNRARQTHLTLEFKKI
jgi:hypothetical protein